MRNSMRDQPARRRCVDHCVLNFDGTTHGVNNATKLDESPVAGALPDSPAVDGIESDR